MDAGTLQSLACASSNTFSPCDPSTFSNRRSFAVSSRSCRATFAWIAAIALYVPRTLFSRDQVRSKLNWLYNRGDVMQVTAIFVPL